MSQILKSASDSLTGKRKIIHDLCIGSNDDAETIAKKADTSVSNVRKEVSIMKKQGLLPPEFTLAGRKSAANNAVESGRSQNEQSKSASNNAAHVPARPQKSERVRVWELLDKGMPDRKIILKLDIEPQSFYKYKSEWLTSMKKEKMADALINVKEDEIEPLLQLMTEMQRANMKPGSYVDAIRKGGVLLHDIDELRRKYYSLQTQIEEREEYNIDLNEKNQWLTKENGDLESRVAGLKSKLEKDQKITDQLGLIFTGIKNDDRFKVFLQHVNREHKDDKHDPNILRAIIQTVVKFAGDQKRLEKIMQIAKDMDTPEAEDLLVEIKKYWTVSYFLLDNEDKPEVLQDYRFLQELERRFLELHG